MTLVAMTRIIIRRERDAPNLFDYVAAAVPCVDDSVALTRDPGRLLCAPVADVLHVPLAKPELHRVPDGDVHIGVWSLAIVVIDSRDPEVSAYCHMREAMRAIKAERVKDG